MSVGAETRARRAWSRLVDAALDRDRRDRPSALLGFWLALPPLTLRTSPWPVVARASSALACRHLGGARAASGALGLGRGRARDRRMALGLLALRVERRQPRRRLRLVGAARRDAALRDAAHVRGDRRDLLRAQRRREHRPRGDDADGRLLRLPRRRQDRLVGARAPRRDGRGRRARARARVLLDPPARRPDRRAARRSTSSPSASRATSSSTSTATRARPTDDPARSPTSTSSFLERRHFLDEVVRRAEPDDLARVRCSWSSRTSSCSRRRSGCGSAPSASTRGRPTRSASPSTRIATRAVIVSGMLAALGGAYLSIGFVGSFNENMTAGRGLHRARGADLRQLAAVRRLRGRAPVRLLERARAAPAASTRGSAGDALPDPARTS